METDDLNTQVSGSSNGLVLDISDDGIPLGVCPSIPSSGIPSGVTGNTPGTRDYAAPPTPLLPSEDGDERVAEMAAWLDTAGPLTLDAEASSPAAKALVALVAGKIGDHDRKRRGPKLRAKLSDAVAAIVGNLLNQWTRPEPRPAYRSNKAEGFTDSPVPYRQFVHAMQGMIDLGLVVTRPGYQQYVDWGDMKSALFGKAARYWPSAELLDLALGCGVTINTVIKDFVAPAPVKAPVVREVIVVNSLKQIVGRRTGLAAKRVIPRETLGTEFDRIREGVEAFNTYAEQHEVRGCLPPRWKRVFTEAVELDGRWTAVGKEGVYQMMGEDERLAKITINGEPVAEADVKASHLSIMHGLLRLPLPEGDLYTFPEIPRAVVKAWITATLGKGSHVRKWSRKALKRDPELNNHKPRQVGRAICDRYPFLAQPAQAVSAAAGLDRLKHIGPPEKLLTHRLMAIEASALTGAMGYLRGRGVLALPVHDSLIVPRSATRLVGGALDGAFNYFAKVRIKWTLEPPPSPPA